MELNEKEIDMNYYIIVIIIAVILLICKLLYSKEEIFEEIDNFKQNLRNKFSPDELNLFCLTKLNTKINRDYLDRSKYFIEKGMKQIFGKTLTDIKKENNTNHSKKKVNRRVTFNATVEESSN